MIDWEEEDEWRRGDGIDGPTCPSCESPDCSSINCRNPDCPQGCRQCCTDPSRLVCVRVVGGGE
jgi:hypothetical protein